MVAPNEELRRSIAFALEAEGLVVLSAAGLASAPAEPARPLGCAVVDEHALRPLGGNLDALAGLACPVVLLVNRLAARHAALGVEVLEKPLLGGSLVKAVAKAVGPRQQVAST